MMGNNWPSHGGRPEQILPHLGLAAHSEVIDFSANLNPLGAPEWLPQRLIESLAGLEAYPDPDYSAACRAIAQHEGLQPAQIRLTNGGAEAIFLAAALLAEGGASRATIVEPTFCEYARACHHYAIAVASLTLEQTAFDEESFDKDSFALDETGALAAMRDSDALFLCRPNNPTGTLVERELIERLLAEGQRHGSLLIVDEAFVDFVTPDERLTPLLARYDNLLLLRSMTKLYTLPGLRLGYLLGAEAVVQRIAALQLPWSVNALAAALVEPLLADADYRARTLAWLDTERPWLECQLRSLGLRVVPSRANFLLLQDSGSRPMSTLLEHLARGGILARHTHNFTGLDGAWLRIAVRSRHDNEQLVKAVADWSAA